MISGLSNPPGTGVRFARTDAGGAYVWSAGQWQLLITATALPASDFGVNGHGLQVDEIAGCNNDATCAYMYYGGYMFFSKNINTADPSGITFCRDNGNLPQQSNDPGNIFNTRAQGSTFAVDPNNKDHVILGTTSNGLYETFNGTTCNPTWTSISSSAIPLSGNRGYRVAFDPGATMTCNNGSGTCSSKAYIYTDGNSGGVYVTSNAGASWAKTGNGPTALQRMKVSYATKGKGNVWAVDGNGAIWRYAGSTWSQMSVPGNCCSSIAINPLNGDQVVGIDNSAISWVSMNASSASPTFTQYNTTLTDGDSPWQAKMQLVATGGATTDGEFDAKTNGVMYEVAAQSLWVATLPASGTSFSWAALDNGIEELLLTGRGEISSANHITFGAQDQGACPLSVPYNLTNNASDCGPLSDLGFLQYASGLSSTPDHSLMFAKVSQDFNGGFDYSGTSTDGFANNYLPFNLWNATVAPSAFTDNGSGLFRVTVPSTVGLSSWSNGSGSIVCGISADPSWVNSIATRCFPITVVSSTSIELIGSHSGWGAGTHNNLLFAPATAMSYHSGDGTIVNIANDNGLVRVTTSGWEIGGDGALVCISGAQMNGASKVNGCWISQNTSGQSFDLGPISTFAAGDTYKTGGVVKTWSQPGGGIAAASATNFTMFGANRSIPTCTDDGGKTWTEINPPGDLLPLTTVTGGPYQAGATSFQVVDGSKVWGYQIYMRLASGRLINNVGYTVSGNTVTLNNLAIPPGDSLVAGAGIANGTGWSNAAYFMTKTIAADQVTPNTFYGVHSDYGLLKWTHCNAPTLVTNVGQNGGFMQWSFSPVLRAVPGEAGHLFYTAGPQGSGVVATGTGLYRSCNGVNNAPNSVNMDRVPGFFSPHAVGFGHAAPNKNYPAILVAGWYSPDDNMANAVYGIWRSIDDGSHGSTGSCTNGTWQNLTAGTQLIFMGWPVLPIEDVLGDPFVYGSVFVAGQIGAWYGNFQ